MRSQLPFRLSLHAPEILVEEIENRFVGAKLVFLLRETVAFVIEDTYSTTPSFFLIASIPWAVRKP
jgi:hypothetical protein